MPRQTVQHDIPAKILERYYEHLRDWDQAIEDRADWTSLRLISADIERTRREFIASVNSRRGADMKRAGKLWLGKDARPEDVDERLMREIIASTSPASGSR